MYGKSHYAYLDNHQIAMQCDTWIIRAMTTPIQDDIVFFETIASHGLDVTPLNHPLYVHRGKMPQEFCKHRRLHLFVLKLCNFDSILVDTG